VKRIRPLGKHKRRVRVNKMGRQKKKGILILARKITSRGMGSHKKSETSEPEVKKRGLVIKGKRGGKKKERPSVCCSVGNVGGEVAEKEARMSRGVFVQDT